MIDADIARLLGEAHERVRATLRERRRLLDALAHALLARETVDREALDTLLRQEQAAAAAASVPASPPGRESRTAPQP